MKSKSIVISIFILCSAHMQAQVMTTIAGTRGMGGYSGDGGPATAAEINPFGLAVDRAGNVYFADQTSNCVRKINRSDTITRFAGNGSCDSFRENTAATAATLCGPSGVATDAKGNVYISDFYNYKIRKVDTSGYVTTFAGTGVRGDNGDGGPATAAEIFNPVLITVDCIGNIYFFDGYIRKVDTSGIISTVVGNGSVGYGGDGGPATAAQLGYTSGLAADCSGNIYISDYIYCSVRKVNSRGIINIFACNYVGGFGGDGGPSTASLLDGPNGVAADHAGNIYICDAGNQVIRKVDTAGIITTFAGTDTTAGYDGDGFSATNALLNFPAGVVIGLDGNLYFVDANNYLIRKVILNETPSGISQIKSKDWVVFPNPTKDYLHVNNVLSVASYRILSIMGSALINGTLKNGNNTIILSALPTGIYFLEIEEAEGGKTVRKLLKQ